MVPFAGFYDDIIAFDGVYETILFVDASAEIAAEVLQHFRLAKVRSRRRRGRCSAEVD